VESNTIWLPQTSGLRGGGLTALGRLTPAARAASGARVVIVGAGLAGLTCAYRLKRAGYVAQVNEA
jgi:NADPH-dependent glutamate synthase beta subunit-like oxidoreductase